MNNIWILLTTFLAGIIACLISLVLVVYFTFVSTPSRVTLKGNDSHSHRDTNTSVLIRGSLRISSEILLMAEAAQGTNNPEEMSIWLQKLYDNSKALSSYFLVRFMGDKIEQPAAKEVDSLAYVDSFAVLNHKSISLYIDEEETMLLREIELSQECSISLYPDSLTDQELFMPQHPIVMQLANGSEMYIYVPTSLEKESWFIVLKRIICEGEDDEPVRQYTEAMKKLVSNTNNELDATSWLNAIVGRMFVAIHSNENVEDWIKQRLSRHTLEADESNQSILGDITIEELEIGNSFPLLSNPKLMKMSIDGELEIEMDIDYTGGARMVVATEATLSVPAWDAYMKPITVPIVVAVKISRFSARILLKIKPYRESNRVWFGFYRHPELILELEVEPLISNKLIKISMVNQVIQRRIKAMMEQYVMLPNMDDLSFWNYSDLFGDPFTQTAGEQGDNSTDVPPNEAQTEDVILPVSVTRDESHGLTKRIEDYIDNIESESPEDDKQSVVEYLGDAAFSLGVISRQIGLDAHAQSLALYAQPAMKYAQEQTVLAGLNAIEKFGLKPEKELVRERRTLRNKTSWSVLGLEISTSAPIERRPRSSTLSSSNSRRIDKYDIVDDGSKISVKPGGSSSFKSDSS